MRLSLRSTLTAAAVLAALSCTDSTGTSPSGSMRPVVARLSLAPRFLPADAEAFRSLAAHGAPITSIHIVLRTLSGDIVADTVINFPEGQESIAIDIAVRITGRSELLDATIELRDALGNVQFSTTQRVTAHDPNLPFTAPASVTLRYVGPGSSVKTLTLTPNGASLEGNRSHELVAAGVDAGGRQVNDVVLVWTSSDTSIARVTGGSGMFATLTPRGPRGPVTITAMSPSGVFGSAQVSVLPTPASLLVVGGNGQTGVGGRDLPGQFVVELQATDGKPIASGLVTFRSITPGGLVGAPGSNTETDGRARTTLRPGRTAGPYVFEASFPNLAPVTITVTATTPPPAPPTQLIALSPIPQSFRVNVPTTSQFLAQLGDAEGNYVSLPGIVVTATMVVSPSGETHVFNATSDALGVLRFSLPTFTTTGSVRFTLTSPVMTNLPFGTFPVNP